MSYFEYSDYRLISDDDSFFSNKYKETAEHLLTQLSDGELKEIARGILYEGGYGNFTVNSFMTTPDNKYKEAYRRLNMANLLITDSATFNVIYQTNTILFHGTNSNALISILKHGMYSEAQAKENGLYVTTGEFAPTPRNFISFTDQLNLALGYSVIRPYKNAPNKSSFSLLIGISPSDIKNKKISTLTIYSDTPEIGIMRHLPKELIRVIAVPKSKVLEVQQLINKYGLTHILVVPSEGIALAGIAPEEFETFDNIGLCKPENLIIHEKQKVIKDDVLKRSITDYSIPQSQPKILIKKVIEILAEKIKNYIPKSQKDDDKYVK